MNHYQLYQMIYGRILEATCAIIAIVSLVGTGVFKGTDVNWVFWAMAILCTVLRYVVTRRMRTLEAKFNLDAR